MMDEMDQTCNMHGRKRCIQDVGWQTSLEGTRQDNI